MRRTAGRVGAALVAAFLLMILAALPAVAHEQRQVGAYQFTVGWQQEPAYVGQLNAVQLFLHDAKGNPIDDLGNPPSLQVMVSTGGQTSSPLSLEPSFDPDTRLGMHGEFTAAIIPTSPGTYRFHFTGSINGQPVDQTFTSSDSTFNNVEEPTSVEFPDDERLTPLTEFLAVAAEIAARADALGKTDSRIAGARAARGARKSLAEQLEQFNAIRAELPQLQKEVRKRLPVAAEWLAESGQLAALPRFDQATARLSRDLPFRAQMQRSWAEAGGDPAGFAAAEQLLAMPEMSEAITRPEAVLAGIGLAAEGLAAGLAKAEPSE